uniref:Mitochondrial assembly of ribosomal large subunit protein 1 n=1 Tax=Heliothis virescens TaxID=7102 RepID=A0A2A4JDR0_HELVI
MLRKIFSRTLTLRPNSFVRCADNVDINRQIHCGVCLRNPRYTSKTNTTPPGLASKYQVITDANPKIIENTAEELYIEHKYPILSDEFDGINLERGKTGVFDIEDLVEILQRENSKDIFVATVPQDIRYVDYICVVSGRNNRHILGNIALHIFTDKARKMYDLETLWSVGPEYDNQMNKNSEVVDMFENYSDYLKDLKPLG